MKILFLSQLVPFPPDAGPKVRSYHTIQYLSGNGHHVTLLAFKRKEDSIQHIDHLKDLCHEVHTVEIKRSRLRDIVALIRSVLTSQPFLIVRDDVKEMHLKIEELLKEGSYDAIHADQLWMAPYAQLALKNSAPGSRPRLVLDQHNAVYLIPLRLSGNNSNPFIRALLSLESRKLARYELAICRQFDCVIWVSEEDKKALSSVANDDADFENDLVIPICVDPETNQTISPSAEAFRVTFLGGMHWPPNAQGIQWFYQNVWPFVQKKSPNSVLTVIGKNPPPALSSEQDGSQVEATGYVDDLSSYLQETAVFIVPLHAGGGMRVKIVDAWSWGLPVVSTAIGAEGITFDDGQNMLIADTPEEFADAVISVLHNQELANQLSVNGRRSVESNYDWRKVYKLWDRVYPR